MFVKVLVLLLAFSVTSVENFVDWVDVDINSPEVQGALQFAVTEHNQSNKGYTSQVVEVIKAQKRGLIGEEYVFTVLMARSDCSHPKPGSPCDINSNPAISQTHECTLTVRSAPWMNIMMLTENTC